MTEKKKRLICLNSIDNLVFAFVEQSDSMFEYNSSDSILLHSIYQTVLNWDVLYQIHRSFGILATGAMLVALDLAIYSYADPFSEAVSSKMILAVTYYI